MKKVYRALTWPIRVLQRHKLASIAVLSLFGSFGYYMLTKVKVPENPNEWEDEEDDT